MVMHSMSSLRAELRALDRSTGGQACFSAVAVLLLVTMAYSAVLTGPGGALVEGGRGDGGTLSQVEEALRELLRDALDDGLRRALDVAVAGEGLDLATALDASIATHLRCRFPAILSGWEVHLVDASALLVMTAPPETPSSGESRAGGMVGTTHGEWAPEATMCVALASPQLDSAGAGSIRLTISERGPPTSPNALSARGGALLDALSDDAGPVAYAIRALLWERAQALAIGGNRTPDALVEAGEAADALVASLRTVAAGAPPPVPGAPPLDIEALLAQSVEGMLVSNLGWVDDYLCLGGGLAGFLSVDGRLSHLTDSLGVLGAVREARRTLVDLAVSAVRGMALGALGASSGPMAQVMSGGGLTDQVSIGIEVLDAMSVDLDQRTAREGLQRNVGMSVARGALEGLLDALGAGGALAGAARSLLTVVESMVGSDGALGALASHTSRVLGAAAAAVARLALAAAKDALRAVMATGAEVAGATTGAPGSDGGDAPSGDIEVEVADLVVSSRWSGEVCCEPAPLVRGLVGSLLGRGKAEGPALGSLPYMAVCHLTVEGWARIEATTQGVSGVAVGASWERPVSLGVAVPVVTGWPLEDVSYSPSTTILQDLMELGGAVYEAATGAVGWLAHRLRDAQEWVAVQVRGIAEDLVENVLAESAYTLSRTLWKIAEALAKRKLNDALNGTWDVLVDLMGDDLRARSTWYLDLFGSRLELSLDPMRQRIDLRLSRDRLTANLTLTRLCDPHPPFAERPVDGYHWGVFGETGLDLGARGLAMFFDPLTLSRSSVLTLVARWGGAEGGGPTGELKVEALEAEKASRRTEVRLSKLARGSRLLSLEGLGAGVDAGLALHGKVVDLPDLGDVTLKALKDAWLASVKGYKVGELLEGAGRAPDAGLFLERVLRELYFALVHRYGELVAALEVFVELAPPAPTGPSLRVSLVLDGPLELLLPLAAWLEGALGGLVASAGSAASGSRLGSGSGLAPSLAEHLLVRSELVWGVAMPSWTLPDALAEDVPPEVGLKLRGEANIAAIAVLAGRDLGAWEVSLELMLEGVPGALLALVPGMGSRDWKWATVTLARVTLRDVSAPKALISSVLYDCAGRDLDLEFVELVNTGRRALDLKGAVLEDDRGRFVLGGRTPLLPGEHLLVVRNATAAREAWGVAPDVVGMRLRLANDGDVVRLVSADGVCIDEVAWEGHLPGWEGLNATEGLALVRREGDLRAREVAAWSVGEPMPRGSAW
jgi:hypothetical protein